jgi:methylase of polypeptide subunit release factors
MTTATALARPQLQHPENPAGLDAPLTQCLVELGRWLRAADYSFTTVTPASHAAVLARQGPADAGLRDIFGWNRSFARGRLPAHIEGLLESHGLLVAHADGRVRACVRFSTLGKQIYAHGGYPTADQDAVFFGPDTYRFARLIDSELRLQPLPGGARIVDVGCGAGAGGMVAASLATSPQLVLADINPRALAFAAANCQIAGMDARFVQGDLYAPLAGQFDLVVANPPYLNDAAARTYRHGGGTFGEALSHRIVREGVPRLRPGGRLILYTGAAICEARDPILGPLRAELDSGAVTWTYAELDPDVFGEELLLPGYEQVERIAAVALVVQKKP